MPEEVSPESKLYVKEEIEKTRKDIREEVEKVNSKATKTFTTVAIVVGLMTGLGVYGSATHYISTSIQDRLGSNALKVFDDNKRKAEQNLTDANNLSKRARDLYDKIVKYETDANHILSSQVYNVIIGTIVPYGGKIESTSGDPCQVRPGWFFCNGASLDREEHKDLFDVIGVAFGAPDPNTFNLPDLRGRVAVGAGTGKNLTPRTLGTKDGEEKHTLTVNEIPSHRHRFEEEGVNYGANTWKGGGSRSGGYVVTKKTAKRDTDISGSGKAHNNLQPFLVVNYIIKAR